MEGSKLHLTCGPLDNRPFGQLGFVNLDGPNHAIWTKEPFTRNSMAAEVRMGKNIYITKKMSKFLKLCFCVVLHTLVQRNKVCVSPSLKH